MCMSMIFSLIWKCYSGVYTLTMYVASFDAMLEGKIYWMLIDLGALLGLYTILLAKFLPWVYAFCF
jgi:hypothetical protein